MYSQKSIKTNRFNIDGNDTPRKIRLALPISDIRRAARSLHARAESLEKRREPDPILRDCQRREAAHCRRLASMIEGGAV